MKTTFQSHSVTHDRLVPKEDFREAPRITRPVLGRYPPASISHGRRLSCGGSTSGSTGGSTSGSTSRTPSGSTSRTASGTTGRANGQSASRGNDRGRGILNVSSPRAPSAAFHVKQRTTSREDAVTIVVATVGAAGGDHGLVGHQRGAVAHVLLKDALTGSRGRTDDRGRGRRSRRRTGGRGPRDGSGGSIAGEATSCRDHNRWGHNGTIHAAGRGEFGATANKLPVAKVVTCIGTAGCHGTLVRDQLGAVLSVRFQNTLPELRRGRPHEEGSADECPHHQQGPSRDRTQ